MIFASINNGSNLYLNDSRMSLEKQQRLVPSDHTMHGQTPLAPSGVEAMIVEGCGGIDVQSSASQHASRGNVTGGAVDGNVSPLVPCAEECECVEGAVVPVQQPEPKLPLPEAVASGEQQSREVTENVSATSLDDAEANARRRLKVLVERGMDVQSVWERELSIPGPLPHAQVQCPSIPEL